ncbi:MAG: hypothetical protein R3228_13110, partial [Halioglobus sp.]|nr:hypothetical protein [Halioglobus sp.]
ASAEIRVRVSYVDALATTEELVSDELVAGPLLPTEPPGDGGEDDTETTIIVEPTTPVENPGSGEGAGDPAGAAPGSGSRPVEDLPGAAPQPTEELAAEDADGKPPEVADESAAAVYASSGVPRTVATEPATAQETLQYIEAANDGLVIMDPLAEARPVAAEQGGAQQVTGQELERLLRATAVKDEIRHVEAVLNSPAMWRGIEAMKQDMDSGSIQSEEFVVQVVSTTGAGVMAGIVAYALRGGALMASLISAMPLWGVYDPLPILATKDDRKKKSDKEREASGDAKKSGEVEALFE